jgi:5-formyltetrahydrofolate cyclo-ligase
VEDVRGQREELRHRLRAERSALAPAQVRAASEACCRHATPLLGPARVVALYSATRGEVDPASLAPLINMVVWPRVEEDTRLSFREGPLAPGTFRLQEPAADAPAHDPEVIVVPGIAFDRRGHRLGFGRGYYDRALKAHPAALRIGFCHSFQLVDEVPVEAHDEPVDHIVTPDGAQATHARSKENP